MPSQPPASKPGDPLVAYQEALHRGHQALLGGDPARALTEYESAAALAADRALPHLSAGRALLALDRAADALAAFERALERGPTDSGSLQGKAEALARLGRAQDASAVVDQIGRLSERGTTPAGGNELDATAESALSRAEVLVIAAERAWADNRTDTAISQWLAASRHHAAVGELDAALDACQRALLADAGDPRIHLELCRLYLARGWTALAVERMELLARLTELDERDGLRADLVELARANQHSDDRLAALALRLESPAPG